MRWWLFLGLSACGFSGAQGPDAVLNDAALDAPSGDADLPDDAVLDAPDDAVLDAPDVVPDAPTDAPPGVTCRSWSTEFDSNPTTTDGPSGAIEWRMRDGLALDGTVSNGTWQTNGPSGALDTTPFDDFEGVTTVDVRMKDRSITGGGYGAVIWVNAGFADGVVAPVIMALDKTGPMSQTFTLFWKPDDGTLMALHTEPNLDEQFQTFHLEVDTVLGQERHRINGGSTVTNSITQQVANTTDKFVTAIGYGSDAEFDYVRVTNCPPGAVP